MSYKLVVDCDVCGREFKVEAEKRSRRRGPDAWEAKDDSSVTFDFNLMTDKQKEQVDGNMYGAELYFDTVCKPCRTALKMVVSERIDTLRKDARRK